MTDSALNSKQIVLNAIQGLPVPRVPTGPLAVHFCARLIGVSIREYTTKSRVLANSVIRYYERFQPDAVWLSADTWVSAQAMGARVGATSNDQPFGGRGKPLVQTPADLERIAPPDPANQGRYPWMLEALQRIVAAVGKQACVVACFDQYPFSLAAALMGINNIMFKLSDDPPFVHAVMERCLEYGLAYARALDAAGADMLSGGDSPAGLISPEAYRAFAWPFEQRLIAGLKSTTAKPVSLHICGNAAPFLADMAKTGADVLEIDHKVDISKACQIVGPQITLWGNLDSLGLLTHAKPEQVRQEAQRVIATVKAAGHARFVLSSGCTLTMETPPANVDALLSAVKAE